MEGGELQGKKRGGFLKILLQKRNDSEGRTRQKPKHSIGSMKIAQQKQMKRKKLSGMTRKEGQQGGALTNKNFQKGSEGRIGGKKKQIL